MAACPVGFMWPKAPYGSSTNSATLACKAEAVARNSRVIRRGFRSRILVFRSNHEYSTLRPLFAGSKNPQLTPELLISRCKLDCALCLVGACHLEKDAGTRRQS